jgi:diguanylate cyclase (GGDEF)-like protein
VESDLEQQLIEAEQLNSCGSWTLFHDRGTMIWSPQLRQLLVADPGQPASIDHLLDRVPANERELVAHQLRRAARSGPWELEHHLQYSDGRQALVLHRATTVFDERGKALRSVGSLQKLCRQASLDQLANTDSITGLPNRLASIRHLKQCIREATYNQQIALLCLDLDHFQGINDSFGMEVGNELLRWTAQQLRHMLAPNDWLARLESDSFLIVRSKGINTLADALQLAHDLEHNLRQVVPLLDPPLPVHVSACVGVSIAPDHGSEAGSLLHWANTALMEAKRQGNATVKAYSTAMSTEIREKLDLEQRLSRAIERQELQLHYQPQWDQRQRLVGAEALLRWRTHRGEEIPPGRFIPLAEQSGLIHCIGRWVLERAIEQMSCWIKENCALPQLAINISAQQLDPDCEPLDQLLIELCRRWQVPPERLELELTETALLRSPKRASETLNRLAEAGVTLAIDDFGTGFSSLATLQRLPLHRLKIDRCFVKDLPDKAADRCIVKATILMAHELGLNCLAEGVETQEQMQQLIALGCDTFQGYLLGRPVPADVFQNAIACARPGTDKTALPA